MKPNVRVVLSLMFLLVVLAPAQNQPVEIQASVSDPFRFVEYGDTRFTDPKDTEASNAEVRQALVRAIADAHPAFITIGGDISYKSDTADWKIWDSETQIWRDRNIPVYPVLGNHDLKGDEKTALANYFQRFPDLKNNRFYSVRAANVLMLLLDSALDETSGPQGDWLTHKLDTIPSDVDFLFIFLHHPPYTSSSDMKLFGGGHSARSSEEKMAKILEARQPKMHARIVVFGSHVHNYERHEHGGITYFVSGGGGAHAYPIDRKPDDPYQSKEINYHYLLVEVDRAQVSITMNRLVITNGKENWSQPDHVTIQAESKAK
jgi:acid phosphatase type 7